MGFFSLLAVGLIMKLVAVIWFITAVVLIFIILIQKGKGGGLGGVFGGGMAGSLLGADTKKPMTWFTIGLVVIFLLLAVLMAKFYVPTVGDIGEEAQTEERVEIPDIRGDVGGMSTEEAVEEVIDFNTNL